MDAGKQTAVAADHNNKEDTDANMPSEGIAKPVADDPPPLYEPPHVRRGRLAAAGGAELPRAAAADQHMRGSDLLGLGFERLTVRDGNADHPAAAAAAAAANARDGEARGATRGPGDGGASGGGDGDGGETAGIASGVSEETRMPTPTRGKGMWRGAREHERGLAVADDHLGAHEGATTAPRDADQARDGSPPWRGRGRGSGSGSGSGSGGQEEGRNLDGWRRNARTRGRGNRRAYVDLDAPGAAVAILEQRNRRLKFLPPDTKPWYEDGD